MLLVKLLIIAVVLVAGFVAFLYLYGWLLRRREIAYTQTRRYARAMYFSGIISMEELQRFYETHPEDEKWPQEQPHK